MQSITRTVAVAGPAADIHRRMQQVQIPIALFMCPRVEMWRGADPSVVEFRTRRRPDEADFLTSLFAFATILPPTDTQHTPGSLSHVSATDAATECLQQIDDRDRALKLELDRIVTGGLLLQERWRDFLPEEETHVANVFSEYAEEGFDTPALASVLSQFEKSKAVIPAEGFRAPSTERPLACLTRPDQKWYFPSVVPETPREQREPSFSELTKPSLPLTQETVEALVDSTIRHFCNSLDAICGSELPTEQKEELLKALAAVPEKTAAKFLEALRNPPNPGLAVLTVQEAALIRDESVSLVRRYAAEGRFGFRLGGREFYIFKDEARSYQPPPPGRPQKS